MARTITTTESDLRVARASLDPYSLLVVMIVLVGNAAIAGVDIALVTLFPALFVIVLWQRQSVPSRELTRLLAIGALGLVLIFLSARIVPDYFPAYWLWSVKFLLLAILMLFGPRPSWPVSNHQIFLGFCVFVIAFARVEEGRLYSFFGPNMLYRIYGLLFVLSVIYIVQNHVRQFPVYVASTALSAFVLVATGSVGALVMFLIPVLLLLTVNRLQTRVLLMTAYFLVAAVLGYTVLNSDSSVVTRILSKFDNLLLSTRLIGWDAILSEPFAILGQTYEHYGSANIWRAFYEYPHNLIVELYAFYGVIGVVVALCCLHTLIFYRPKMSVEYVAFVVVFLGAQLSGDLSDNYGAVVLGIVLFARHWNEAHGLGHRFRRAQV